ETFARLICFVPGFKLFAADVPAHIDDEDVEWGGVFAEAADQVVQFLIAVGPVARSPYSEGEARRERDASGNAGEVLQGLAIEMSVAEEVPILPVAGGPQHDPGPGAVFALGEGEVVGVKERACGVIDEDPSAARDEAGVHGRFQFVASRAVEGARGALKIAGVGGSGMPGDEIAIQRERDVEV